MPVECPLELRGNSLDLLFEPCDACPAGGALPVADELRRVVAHEFQVHGELISNSGIFQNYWWLTHGDQPLSCYVSRLATCGGAAMNRHRRLAALALVLVLFGCAGSASAPYSQSDARDPYGRTGDMGGGGGGGSM